MHHVYPRCTQASQLDSDTISYDGEVRPRKAIINKNSIWSSKALRVACGKLNNLREIYDRSCTRSVDSDIKYGRRVELLMDSLLGTLLCILYFGALAQCWLIEETWRVMLFKSYQDVELSFVRLNFITNSVCILYLNKSVLFNDILSIFSNELTHCYTF